MPAARLAAVLTAILAATSLPAAGGAGSAPTLQERARQLRERNSQLGARTHEALLQLYSLETRLGRARSTLADLRARRAELAAEQRLARRQVAITQRAVGAAQDELSSLARALYEHGEPDPLAVLLGASSLDDAISGLDGIQRAADQSRHVIAQARATRARLQDLTSRLMRQQVDLRRLTARAEATATALASARAERAGYIAGLARERALTKREVASLEAQAQAAQARSAELTASAPAPSFADQVAPLTSVLVARSGSMLTVSSTAYALPGTTATGIPVGWGVVAVDPSVIPLGTRLFIPGYGEGVAADTGSAVRGATIDLWFPTLEQARAWGRKTVTITIH